ncbi:MAG: penicillin-binding protein activator [Alphaproteobacteria bacterium]|nr:MAG: penicillin-binding protein activator [Alphaproteobacteria bacterium]
MVARGIRDLTRLLAIFAVSLSLAACGGDGEKPAVRIKAPDRPHSSQPQQLGQGDEPAQESLTTPAKGTLKVAILLPLSGPERDAGDALLKAATMALFDAYDPRLVLLPFDTRAEPAEAADAAEQAVKAGARIVIGPLLADNVEAAGAVLARHKIPLLGFSNDAQVAAPGRFILGFMPEAEVQRVIDFTLDQGKRRYAALLPDGLYGDRVRAAFGDAVSAGGGRVTAMERYPADPDSVFNPVKRLANYDARTRALKGEIDYLRSLRDDTTDEIADRLEKSETLDPVPYDVVMLPEGGSLLRTVAPLLPFYEIDPATVKFVGTGLWNDPSLVREPPLQGAWFAAPAPEAPAKFLARFKNLYDIDPPRITTLAYDAMSLVAALARDWTGEPGDEPFSLDRLTDDRGFVGLDGLFRLLPDGTNERELAVLEIQKGGFRVVDAAPGAFPAFGYSLRALRRSASQEGN